MGALCDSYVGLDQKVDLTFNALTEDKVKREIFVHHEDEELDLQPTLFQQFMGEFNHEEESEEEEEEEDKRKSKVKKETASLGEGIAAKAEEDSDSDEEDK